MVLGAEQFVQGRGHPAAKLSPVRVERPAQSFLELAHRERRVGGDAGGQFLCGRPELVMGDDATDETDVARPARIEDLAGEEQFGGALAAYEASQAADPGDVGAQAAQDEELTEPSLL